MTLGTLNGRKFCKTLEYASSSFPDSSPELSNMDDCKDDIGDEASDDASAGDEDWFGDF
jgi:hypothetical protein